MDTWPCVTSVFDSVVATIFGDNKHEFLHQYLLLFLNFSWYRHSTLRDPPTMPLTLWGPLRDKQPGTQRSSRAGGSHIARCGWAIAPAQMSPAAAPAQPVLRSQSPSRRTVRPAGSHFCFSSSLAASLFSFFSVLFLELLRRWGSPRSKPTGGAGDPPATFCVTACPLFYGKAEDLTKAETTSSSRLTHTRAPPLHFLGRKTRLEMCPEKARPPRSLLSSCQTSTARKKKGTELKMMRAR